MAEPKHQRRAYEELLSMWQRVFDACTDLPRRPEAPVVLALHLALHLALWGGRRHAMLVQLEEAPLRQWSGEVDQVGLAAVSSPSRAASRRHVPFHGRALA